MRVALFVTCFNDTLFPETGRAVVTVLERLGCQVDFPLEQTCCGQMHFNSGYADDGRMPGPFPLCRQFVVTALPQPRGSSASRSRPSAAK